MLEGVFLVYDAGVSAHVHYVTRVLQSQTYKPNDKVYYIAYELLMCERTYIQQLNAIVNVGVQVRCRCTRMSRAQTLPAMLRTHCTDTPLPASVSALVAAARPIYDYHMTVLLLELQQKCDAWCALANRDEDEVAEEQRICVFPTRLWSECFLRR